MPLDLQQKVRHYIIEVWAPFVEEKDADQIASLPLKLRGELAWRAAGTTLGLMRLFRHMSPEDLRWIAAGAEPKRSAAGQEIFRFGDESGGCIYVLQRGSAAVHAGWRQVTTVHAPALLAPSALFEPLLTHLMEVASDDDEERHSPEKLTIPRACTRAQHTVVAKASCCLWKVNGWDVAALVEAHPSILNGICSSYLAVS